MPRTVRIVPGGMVFHVLNRAQPQAELEVVQKSVERGRPFGSATWQAVTAEQLGLEFTFQPRGRPRKRQ